MSLQCFSSIFIWTHWDMTPWCTCIRMPLVTPYITLISHLLDIPALESLNLVDWTWSTSGSRQKIWSNSAPYCPRQSSAYNYAKTHPHTQNVASSTTTWHTLKEHTIETRSRLLLEEIGNKGKARFIMGCGVPVRCHRVWGQGGGRGRHITAPLQEPGLGSMVWGHREHLANF